MTESEMWLEIAREYDGTGNCSIGLCAAITNLPDGHKVSMRKRLLRLSPHRGATWYWSMHRDRSSRTLRATACGFLAAMAEEA